MVKGNVVGPVRRVCADIIGDDAVDLEIMEVSLGIQRIAKSKSDRDGLLIKAALLSLGRSVDEYRGITGIRHPEYDSFTHWLGRESNKAFQHELGVSSGMAEIVTSSVENAEIKE